MTLDHLPFSPSCPSTVVKPRLWRAFLRSNGSLKIGFIFTAFFLTGRIVYQAFFFPCDPSWRLPDWHLSSQFDPDSLELADPKLAYLLPELTPESTVLDDPSPPLPPSPVSDVLALDQIRDIVASTRGFFSRDYSLSLGWNNVSVYLGTRYQSQIIS